MLSNKPILATVGCYCLLLASSVQAELSATSGFVSYQCPAYLELDFQSYAFEGFTVYDGSIEDQRTLKPDPVPADAVEPSVWEYGYGSPLLSERPLYIKCRYKDTGHYLVLEAQGARRCTFGVGTPIECEQ